MQSKIGVSIKKFQSDFYVALTKLFIVTLTLLFNVPFKTLQLLFKTFIFKNALFSRYLTVAGLLGHAV